MLIEHVGYPRALLVSDGMGVEDGVIFMTRPSSQVSSGSLPPKFYINGAFHPFLLLDAQHSFSI